MDHLIDSSLLPILGKAVTSRNIFNKYLSSRLYFRPVVFRLADRTEDAKSVRIECVCESHGCVGCERCRAEPNTLRYAASCRTESGYRSSLRCVLRRCQGFLLSSSRPAASRTHSCVRPSVHPSVLSSIHVHPVRTSVREK